MGRTLLREHLGNKRTFFVYQFGDQPHLVRTGNGILGLSRRAVQVAQRLAEHDLRHDSFDISVANKMNVADNIDTQFLIFVNIPENDLSFVLEPPKNGNSSQALTRM
jgi:hypothetical protein